MLLANYTDVPATDGFDADVFAACHSYVRIRTYSGGRLETVSPGHDSRLVVRQGNSAYVRLRVKWSQIQTCQRDEETSLQERRFAVTGRRCLGTGVKGSTGVLCGPCGGARIAASVRSENERPAAFDEAIAHFRQHLLPAGVVCS